MRSLRNRWVVSLLVVAIAVLALAGGAASAAPRGPEYNGPVWLAVSLTDTFTMSELDEVGSPTLFLNIGTFVATDDPLGTTFQNVAVPPLALPPGMTIEDLYGNQATVFGTVYTTGTEGEFHMYTPVGGEIPPEIQMAVHEASVADHNGLFDLLGTFENPSFPTAWEISNTIAGFLDRNSPYGPSDVFQHVFATEEVLRPTADGLTLSVTSEGEMFPHDPSGPVLIYSFSLDEDGEVDASLGIPIAIDAVPGSAQNSVNVGKKGDFTIALLTGGDFDAADVDPDTVRIGSVHGDKPTLRDADSDGDKDLVCHWRVEDLVAAGLNAGIDVIFVVADLKAGGTVAGHDTIDTFVK